MISPNMRPSHQNRHFFDAERQIADLAGGGSRPSARADDKPGQNEPNPVTQKDLRVSTFFDMIPLSCQVKTPFDLKSQFVAATFTATNSGKGRNHGEHLQENHHPPQAGRQDCEVRDTGSGQSFRDNQEMVRPVHESRRQETHKIAVN